MSYKPVWKKPEEEISQKVEEKVKIELDNKIKSEVDRRVSELLKEREEKEKTEKASKIAKAVDIAKALKGEGGLEKDFKTATDREKADKEKSEKDMLCPTCHTGHVHRLETDKSGLVYKCHGDKCGYEFVFVPKTADYKCARCGMPVKKPNDPVKIADMNCPFCGGEKSIRFDWGKLWTVRK